MCHDRYLLVTDYHPYALALIAYAPPGAYVRDHRLFVTVALPKRRFSATDVAELVQRATGFTPPNYDTLAFCEHRSPRELFAARRTLPGTGRAVRKE